jgi:hypothetical protein
MDGNLLGNAIAGSLFALVIVVAVFLIGAGEARLRYARPMIVAGALQIGKAWRGWLWIAVLALAATVALSACESDQEPHAKDKLADSNQTPLKSCTWDSVDSLRIKGLSHDDQVSICNTMQIALGRPASVGLARKMSNLVIIMQIGGSADTAKEITYQTMNVVEARGKVDNDKAIDGSMETIAKIFSGSQGHVTPRDLNVFLRSAGPTAKTLSDDGLLRMAAVIWEEKKANGE